MGESVEARSESVGGRKGMRMRKGRREGPTRSQGHKDLLKPEAECITVSILGSTFEGFVDLSTVDTTSVPSGTSLRCPLKEAHSWSPHKVGQSRDGRRGQRESRQDRGRGRRMRKEATRKGREREANTSQAVTEAG
jgi:hypothetical protein